MKTRYLAGASLLALGLGLTAPAWGQATATINDETGAVRENTASDTVTRRDNALDDSFRNGAGIAHTQQNNGAQNVLSAATAVIARMDADGDDTDARADVNAVTEDNNTVHIGGNDRDYGAGFNSLDRSNGISGSFFSFQGVSSTQQNNGDHNTIGAATAVVGAVDSTGNVTADAVADARTADQFGATDEDVLTDVTSTRSNVIDGGSFNNAAGIMTSQQNNGNANAMAASTAVVGEVGGSTGTVDQTADANPEMEVGAVSQDSIVPTGDFAQAGNVERSNLISGSFNNAAGIMTSQQNNGDANAIAAATSAVGRVGGTSDDIDQTASADSFEIDGLVVDDDGATRTNLINPSFNNASGVATVQENNGNANVIGAATSVAGITGDAGDVDQTAEASDHDVIGVTATDVGTTRTNDIVDSFTNFEGVATVQQNNGDGNAIAAATSVVGAGRDIDSLDQTTDAEDNRLNRDADSVIIATSTDGTRSNAITNSFRGASGVVTVQENNGNANIVASATTVTGVGRDVEGALDQVEGEVDVEDNRIDDVFATSIGGTRTNTIDATSFNNFMGVATVQQNNGDANTMNAATAVAGVGRDVDGNLEQNEVDLEDNRANDFILADGGEELPASTRTNSLDGSFNGAAGILTVQQNNGNGNSINAGTAVAAIGRDVGTDVGGDAIDQDAETDDFRVGDGSGIDSIEDWGSDRDNAITGAFNNSRGVATVQQNNGDGNVIGASTTIAAVGRNVDGRVDQDIDVGAESGSETNLVTQIQTVDLGSDRDNVINPSFNGAQGTAQVQQNNGSGNTLAASTAIVAAVGDIDDVEQTVDAVGEVNSVFVTDQGSTRTNTLLDSFDNAQGVYTVQQNNGDANAMGAGTAVAASGYGIDQTTGDALPPAPGGSSGSVDQTVNATGDLTGLSITSSDLADRDNEIVGSFSNAAGVFSLQQNNGSANVMNIGTGVVASTGGFGDVTQDIDAGGELFGLGFAVEDLDTSRSNLIDPSFNGASGIVSAQQNNGDLNLMNVANGVVVNGLNGGGGDLVDQQVETTGAIASIGRFAGDEGQIRENEISDRSFNGFQGVASVQQNNGDLNVISTANGVTINGGSQPQGSIGDEEGSQVARTDGLLVGLLTAAEDVDVINDSGMRNNLIDNSFGNSPDGSAGIVAVQQNNGNMNVMGVANAVRVDLGAAGNNGGTEDVAGDQLAESLGTITGFITAAEHESVAGFPNPSAPDVFDRRNEIQNNAFNGFAGHAAIQQNNGDNNVLGSATALAAAVGSASPASGDDLDSVENSIANTDGTVINGFAFDSESNRLNEIDSAFRGAEGILKAQQNNGNNNVVGEATAVVANLGARNRSDGDGETMNAATGTGLVQDVVAEVDNNTDRLNTINNGSFNNAAGVVAVQQNNGDNNVMGSSTAIAANQEVGGGSGLFGPAVSTATLNGTVTNASAVMTNVTDLGELTPLQNTIEGSFNGFQGVGTVQQNNGDNNVISSAIAVTANFSTN